MIAAFFVLIFSAFLPALLGISLVGNMLKEFPYIYSLIFYFVFSCFNGFNTQRIMNVLIHDWIEQDFYEKHFKKGK